MEELEACNVDKFIWIKSVIQAEGDDALTKVYYLKNRSKISKKEKKKIEEEIKLLVTHKKKGLKPKMKLTISTLLIIATAITLTSCTVPYHQRTVTRQYDGQGKLTGTTIVENIQQRDPYSMPLHPAIDSQTYQK